MLGRKHACSLLREAQVPDGGSALLEEARSANHILHPGLSSAEEGGRGCFHTAYMGAWLRCHQPLQGAVVNTCKEGDHSSIWVQERDNVHANPGFFFIFFLTLDVYLDLPTLCPSEPAGSWGFSSVP